MSKNQMDCDDVVKNQGSAVTDLGLLGLRVVTGGLMAGHGAQKLFGSFGGHGLEGTAGWLESLGMTPGKRWAPAAAVSEFAGGLLTLLGLFNPLGPLTLLGPMALAIGKAHWGKPIWVTEGGAELPLTNVAVAGTLALAGPGRFAADRLFGIRLPWIIVALFSLATAAGIAVGLATPNPSNQEDQEDATSQLSGEDQTKPSPASS